MCYVLKFDAGKERIYSDVTEPAFTLHNSNINKQLHRTLSCSLVNVFGAIVAAIC